MDPPPRRDVRYVLIVLGAALLLMGLLLVAVSAIVSDALSIGSGACAAPCPGDPSAWILWLGLPFLGTGLFLLGLGLLWTFHPRLR
jgi:hypothetical protein